MLAIALALALQPAPQPVPPVGTAPAPPAEAQLPPRPGPWPAVEVAEPPPPLSGVESSASPAAAPADADPLAPVPRPMEVEVERDAITDHLSAFAVARTPGARIEIGCDLRRHDGVFVRFSGRTWLARGNAITGERPLWHRFDLDRPVRAFWVVRHRRATLYELDDVGPFIAHLLASRRLVIRAIDIEDREVDTRFILVDAAPAVDRVIALCGDERLLAWLGRKA